MKRRRLRIEDGGWQSRSVMECGGKRSTTPLSNATGTVEKLRRRFALPEQSIICTVLALLLSTLIFQPLTASAQPYSIDWYKIAGGGGTSTGGTYQVSGTIGQPDASGAMTGGNYSLTGGFWSLIAVVQTGGAPTLYITSSGNTVTVYWQDVSGWSLQQNSNLNSLGGWSVNSSWTTSNGTNYLYITPPVGNLFFRLKQ